MRIKQKISFLLADYAVRIIAARHFPELAKLEPIRSIETARVAYTAIYAIYDINYKYDINYNYDSIITVIIDVVDIVRYNPPTISDTAEVAEYVADTVAYATIANIINSAEYVTNLRTLIDIAINPNRYW